MITYNGIIDYFREFADKHFQIHSFTEGTADKIDLQKINDYPVLHIDITGTDIQDKMLVFNLDVYIITSAQSDDEAQRVNALSSMLMIMQDLRAEFFEGKYVVPKLLMLRGSEELSCTPIQEDFNNRVYGWSTSMSVTGINEATRCTIPYPTYNDVMEQWIGGVWQKPFDSDLFGNFYWWSANTQLQDNITYTADGVLTFTSIKSNNWLSLNYLTSNVASQTDKIRYIEDEQAFRLKGSGNPYWFINTIVTHTERYYYFALKVKNIKSLDAEDTSLFQIYSSGQADGIRVSIGSPTATNTTIRNKIRLSNWDDSVKESPVNISDGSNDYIREESLTFGLQIGGDDESSVVKLVLDGEVVSTLTIPTGELETIIIGNNQTGNSATASFDLEEFYAYRHHGISDHLTNFIKVTDWLKYR